MDTRQEYSIKGLGSALLPTVRTVPVDLASSAVLWYTCTIGNTFMAPAYIFGIGDLNHVMLHVEIKFVIGIDSYSMASSRLPYA
jgi:hypothetical protein